MSQLAKLSMACCQLKEVPAEISKVSSLRFLDLSFNNIHTLPNVGVWGLQQLVGGLVVMRCRGALQRRKQIEMCRRTQCERWLW